MNNRTRKTKWTKKLKAIVISVGLAFAVALGGACAAIGVSLADNNRRLDGSFAGGVADDNTPQVPTAEETFYAGATVGETTYATSAEAWEAAVSYSLAHEGAPVEFRLDRSWTGKAAKVTTTTTGTGTDAVTTTTVEDAGGFGTAVTNEDGALSENSPFGLAGSLNVPAKAQIILNLGDRNYTLNRNVGSTAIDNGEVVTVSGGTLYIKGNGTITGGNSATCGGGILIENGEAYMYEGNINGNTTHDYAGGGVYVNDGQTFNLCGGYIYDNTVSLTTNVSDEKYGWISGGGGVYANKGATFNMYGGVIGTDAKGAKGISNRAINGDAAHVNVFEGTFNLYDGVICNMAAGDSSTASIRLNGGTLNMTGGTIKNNICNGNTAGIMGCFTSINISGGEFLNNEGRGGAQGGGALYSCEGDVNITGGRFDGNKGVSGGAISFYRSPEAIKEGTPAITANFTNVELTNNTATGSSRVNGNGGAVNIAQGVNANFTNVTITGNIANNGNGGGICATELTETIKENETDETGTLKVTYGTVTLTNCDVSHNTAIKVSDGTGAAGGVYVCGHAVLTDTSVNYNESEGTGTAVCVQGNADIYNREDESTYGTLVINGNTEIAYNRAKYSISGIYIVRGKADIYGGKYHHNECHIYGSGALCTNTADVNIINRDNTPVFEDNFAQNSGGAIYYQGITNVYIEGAEFKNNSTVGHGGAIYAGSGTKSSLTIKNTVFNGNCSNSVGGAIYTNVVTTLEGCTFTENTSKNSVGGAITFYGKAIVTDCTFKENKAPDGGALYLNNENTQVLEFHGKTVIENNIAEKFGGAMTCGSNTRVQVDGNIRITGNFNGAGMPDNIMFNNNGFLMSVPSNYNITANSVIGLNVYGSALDSSKNIFLEGAKPSNLTFESDSEYFEIITTSADSRLSFKSSYSTDNATRWNKAVADSIAKYDANNKDPNHNQVVVKLTSDWTENSAHSFGDANNETSLGVPAHANILLDLGAFSIRRNIATGTVFTPAMFGIHGTLTIVGNGSLTGCKASGGGTVIRMFDGSVVNMYGGRLTGNSGAATGGGIICVDSGATLNMYNGHIENNTGATPVYVDGGAFNMYGGHISNNIKSSGNGGGVYAKPGSIVNLYDGQIFSNKATEGGGIYAENGATINIGKAETVNGKTVYSGDVRISGNTGTLNGAGIRTDGGNLNIYSGYITSNVLASTATHGGGGVWAGGTVRIYGGEISKNSSTGWSGGVYVQAGSTVEMHGGKIINNTANGVGGGIDVDAPLTITGGEISGNHSDIQGGGVHTDSSPIIIGEKNGDNSKIIISGNSSDKYGGGVCINTTQSVGASLKLYSGTISNNTATTHGGGGIAITGAAIFEMSGGKILNNTAVKGGGIMLDNGAITTSTGRREFTISGGEISGNTGEFGGGIMLWADSLFTMSNTVVRNNISTTDAGGLNIGSSSEAIITNCEFSGNAATSNGGGLRVAPGSTATITNCEIFGNTATSNGGGVCVVNTSTLTMNGGSVSNNNASVGGGLWVDQSTFIMNSGEVADNDATNAGGGIDGGIRGTTLTIKSGKIYGNTSGVNGAAISLGGTADGVIGTVNLSGDVEIYNNTARGGSCSGGIYLLGNGVLNMSGGSIYDNRSGNIGGGVSLIKYGTSYIPEMTMTGGTISNNYAEVGGGGVYVGGNMTISGTAKISGNYAGGVGGGVQVVNNATLTMNGGVIGGETAEEGNISVRGGGICNLGTVEFANAKLNYNQAITNDVDGGMLQYIDLPNHGAHGGGIYNTGTFTMKSGEIAYNTAVNGFGGGINSDGTFNMSGGSIHHNYAGVGGGGKSNGPVVMTGGTITENTAEFGAGYYIDGSSTLTVSGKVVIAENTVRGGALGNVLLDAAHTVTIGGTLTSGSEIWVTTNYKNAADEPVENAFTTGFAASSGLAHPNLAFYADNDKKVVGKTSAGEAVLVDAVKVNINVYDKGGNNVTEQKFVKVDVGSSITYESAADSVTFNTVQGGGNLEVKVDVPEVKGYTPYLYDPVTETKINNGDALITDMAGDSNREAQLDVKYEPNADTPYTVYYILQLPEANQYTDRNGYLKTRDLSELTRSPSVRIFRGTGTTDTEFAYINGETALADWSERQYYSYYDVEGTPNIDGDGNGHVIVLLKLNEYTVTYNGNGGTPSRQTKIFKYGATLTAPTRTPTKRMTTFMGWYDSNGVQVIDEKGKLVSTYSPSTVSADMTLTARYNATTYHIRFDMNIDTGEDYSIETQYALQMETDSTTLDGTNGFVAWDTDRLFPEADGFNYQGSNNVFTIDYTIENIPYTMSIRNVRPTAVGYTFAGWYRENDDGSTSRVDTIAPPTSNTSDKFPIIYRAHWNPTSYTVRFDTQDGNAVSNATVQNLCTLEDLLGTENKSGIAPTPVRAGYKFGGWYVDSETLVSVREACVNTDGLFSVAALGRWYRVNDNQYEHDFSNLTLYARWISEDLFVHHTTNANGNPTFHVAHNDCEDEYGDAFHDTDITIGNFSLLNAVHIGDTITVTPNPNTGYKFDHLVIETANGSSHQPSGETSFVISNSYVTDLPDGEHKGVHVSVVYTEDRFTITYDLNGGRLEGQANYTRSYSPSELNEGHSNRTRLPNNLVREGYTFLGWTFADGDSNDDNNQIAFVSDHGVDTTENMFGKNIYMVAPTVENKVVYSNVTLKAKWEAQEAKVNLYNATYTTTDYDGMKDEDGNSVEGGYVITEAEDHINKLKTDMKIEILNPSRTSYDFLGWATSRNGAVVYPVVSGKDTISYTVNAENDVNGRPLNLNNLYAIWHIKGVDRIIMTVDNNGATYGGTITMTAQTAQTYIPAEAGGQINITYKWYLIADGMYDACFTEGQVFIDIVDGKEKVTGYEFGGVFYGEDGKTVQTTQPSGDAFPYRRFDEARSVEAGYCVLKATDTKSQGEASSLARTLVNDCGNYVCVVTVTGVEDSGSTTTAGGYGEIEISMNKAVYSNLLLESKEVPYNSEALWGEIRLSFAKSGDGASISEDRTVITLPDGSKVVATYRYFTGTGVNRREITNLDEIRNVGTYYVTVEFAWAADGDNGNYEPLEAIETELVITPYEISSIGFKFVHGDDSTIPQTFTGVYDGTAYGVTASINDTFGLDGAHVAQVDDIELIVSINTVTANGADQPFTGDTTVNAGTYSLVVSTTLGGDAEAVKNYVLKRGITLRQVYTITKSSYAVKGNIAFEDKTVEFDNLDHTIEVEVLNGMTLPDTVTPTYRLVDYARENEKYVYNPSGNVGNDAGVYTVEVVFNDTNSANYEQLETMTATLTITKANLFDYFANKRAETVDLLGEADFVGRTFKFDASLESKPYKPVVKTGSRLANTSIFTITYKYYLVGEDGTRTEKPDGFFEAGRYEIVADIKYADERYKNDFEEVQENESTIVYVIEDVDVKEVIVHFTQAFENSGKLALLNGTFDYSWIRQIDVVYAYEDVDGSTVTSTRYINQEEDIRMAEIKYGDDTHTSFWKVGEFNMTVGVYGSDCEVTVNVKQEIDVTDGSNFSVEYNTGNEWKRVGDDGYDGVQLESGSYQFRVSFNAVGTDGAVNTVSCGVSTVGNAALKLGENELAINTGDTNSVNYIFNGKIAVNMYKVITSAEETLKWQYSADGGRNWRDFEQDGDGNYIYSMPYIGSEYLIRVTFMDGGVLQSCKAYAFDNATQRRLTVQNCIDGGYEMYVGLDGNYLLDESVTCGMSVAPRVLEVTWDRESFIYNGNYQAPVITSDNIAAVDKGLITFDYQLFEYDEDAENHMGAQTSEADVFDANKYVIAVVLRGEESVIANYTTDNSATAVKTFTIEKAKAAVSVTYNEHNYGTNVTFAGNAHGLRTDALRASFTGTTVEGRLAFVNGTDPQTGKPIEINGNDDIIKNLIRNAGNPYVSYAFIPDDDKNYDVTYGRLMLTVNAQTPKRGTDSLLIELGEGAIKHYLVNQNFNTKGINVYRMYESYYTEGNNWYGYRGEPITTNLNLRINGAAANGHTITKEEVSGGTIVLTAIVGTDRGTLNIPVEEKKAVKLEISSEDYKTVFYVGETFDFSNMQFTVTYDDETIQEGLTRGSVTCDYDNYVFENAGTFEVTFSYFDAVCTMNVEVKAKEDLTIVEFSDSDKLLVYNDGNPIDIPVLKFLIDGKTIDDTLYGNYGIKVSYTILRNNSQLSEITEVGRYLIRYSVDVSGNPRFNKPAARSVPVEVTLNRYKVTIGKPAAESLIAVYTGSGIEIPDPEEIKAIDAKTGLDVTPTSVRYYIDGTEIINDYGWIKDKAGTYTVTVVVTVDDEETRAEYEFEIMQAKNGNLFVETHTVVLKEGETFPVFPVTADFGASTAVIKYSKDRNAADADWTTEAPATAGVWYVKVTIDGTDDYTGVSIIEPFEVRTNGANASTGDGLVEGSIEGENGVGTDWSLEIRQLDSETVSEVSIDKQNVLDGYEVIFKAGSAPVKDEGEYTVRIKLTDELKGRKDLNVYFVDAEGNKTKLNASVEGDFIAVKMSSFDGSVIITNAVPGEPIGLLVAVIVLGVIAAGMIAACIIVFVKKKKRGAE